MNKIFDIIFLDEVFQFLKELDKKHSEKILFNIRKAQTAHDPELFKKLNNNIWEFRTLYHGIHYRLLAFWDKENSESTLIVSTHGFVKKRSRVSDNELQKAEKIRIKYLASKEKLKIK